MRSYKKLWTKLYTAFVIAAIPLLMIMQSCGGSSGGGASDYAGGGIGGTGKAVGTITAFGSIFVNGVEHSTAGVPISVNGSAATENDLDVGMKVVISKNHGQTEAVEYDPDLSGPVNNVDLAAGTLDVMGRTVVVNSTTVFKGVSGLGGLNTGELVEVSGFSDSAGRLRAAYIRRDNAIQVFSIEGTVSNHDQAAKTFSIGSLSVDYSGVSSPPAFGNGSYVDVKGTMPGNMLVAVSLELDRLLPSAASGDDMEIEGIITSVTSPTDFKLNGLRVVTTANTKFEHGTSADIKIDNAVEVDGSVDTNGSIIADKIEFRFNESRDVELEGSVSTVDPVNATVTIFGIQVQITANTSLEDEVQNLRPFALSDISKGDFLEIGGFVDNSGTVVASKLERKSDPGSGNDTLKGPVDMNSESGTASFGILGITVDVSGAQTFKDNNDKVIGVAAFFSAIDDTKDPGDIVKVKGSYLGGTAFAADEAEIEKIN